MECLFKKIPEDIVINHIMPYAYNIQPKELLIDIRSYMTDFQIVMDCYYIHYNERILLHDLHMFCRSNMASIFGEDYLNCSIKTVTHIMNELHEFEFWNLYYNSFPSSKIHQRVKLLWAYLKPSHRTKFINEYILLE